MAFPSYVHAVIATDDPACWPIQQQGINECGVTAPANALNLLLGKREFDKDSFVVEAGQFFQRNYGGSPSFVTGQLIKRHGFGTHFGMLKHTDARTVLRDLIDRHVPVCVELGANRWGPLTLYGQHTIVLVGYSDLYTDAASQQHQEFYFIDAQYPADGQAFGLETNDVDRDGDGVVEHYPGNRTMEQSEFLGNYPTGIYFPVFATQGAHDDWYAAHMTQITKFPVFGSLAADFLTGSDDRWVG